MSTDIRPSPPPAPTSSAIKQLVGADPRHGPLPLLLLALTAVTGLVDAVSILQLGRVFVANMTGNVVFSGFALAGAPGFSLSASLFALPGFLAGAAVGGWLIGRMGRDRVLLLGAGAATETVLVLAACLLAFAVGTPFSNAVRDVIAALLAVAMGTQNAVSRKVAVPDMTTTTALTMTLTGIGADLPSRSYGPALLRRVSAVATLVGCAVVGAVLVLHTSVVVTLGAAAGILALATAGSALAARRPGTWREGAPSSQPLPRPSPAARVRTEDRGAGASHHLPRSDQPIASFS